MIGAAVVLLPRVSTLLAAAGASSPPDVISGRIVKECITVSEVRLAAEQRTEFGKGAARRTRRAGKIPAVLYGHGAETTHLSLPAIEFARILRKHGRNAVLTLQIGPKTELALTKAIDVHPLKDYIEHVDLLLVKRGEQVAVDVPLTLTGSVAPGNLLTQDLTTIKVEAEALHIPEQFEFSIEGADAGTQIHASQIELPRGVTLVTDPEALVAVVNPATVADVEPAAEVAGPAAAAETEAEETEADKPE